MLFIGNFLYYAKKNLNKLLDNCSFAKNSEKKNFMDLIENYMLEILRKKTTENSSRKILKKCLQITDKEVAKY